MSYRKWLFVLALCTFAGCMPGGSWSSGDRVLVSKCAYDTIGQTPQRYNVVVFKYPRRPIENNTPKNYIKRLWGLPGELLAIFFGRVYHMPSPSPAGEHFFDEDKNVDADKLWERQYMHENEDRLRKLFDEGAFTILRKPPEVMLALRRIVYDNDFQAKDLVGKVPPRWNPSDKSGWQAEKAHDFVHKGTNKDEIDWLRYQHLLRPHGAIAGGLQIKPHLITDVMGYNSYRLFDGFREAGDDGTDRSPRQHWVGDLMLECQVDVREPQGELYLEVSKGIHRFQACWDLATGTCTLYKLTFKDDQLEKKEEMGSAPTRVKGSGSYQLRLANFDARLVVWVDRDLPFKDGVEYPPPEVRGPKDQNLPEDALVARRGPTKNDLQPANVGSKGAHVRLSQLRLWRDTYYTTQVSGTDYVGPMAGEDWADPTKWGTLKHQRSLTLYVQPGHFLVMGDNSPNSSDSRDWGTVPERLMLGRALVVYYPFQRAGAIR